MLLAGDIGGTKTRLALFASRGELRTPLMEATLPSGRYHSLEALIQDFLSQITAPIDKASFGVAGPVMAGKAKITNLPWLMDEQRLSETLHVPVVHLLNDLDAMAHGVPLLEAIDLHTINAGQPDPHGALAIVAPGTGLGEAFLTRENARYRAHPSEGGHADFAPTNRLELGLLSYLLDRFEHVSYEQVCSGIGLPHIYGYLKETGTFEEPAWLAKQLAVAADHTPVIVNAALSDDNPPTLCVETLKLFVSVLAAEAGNMALKILATGGVYLGGGIPPRILSFIEHEEFMRSFCNKGRFSDLLKHVPLHVVLNDKLALIGAAYHGFEEGENDS